MNRTPLAASLSTSATQQVAGTLKAYGLARTTGDKYAVEWVVDAFSKCGINYEHSERDRSSLYLDALPLFTSGRARLLDSRRLIAQFGGLERRTSPVGKDRVDHGPGGHDDLANSVAGALVAAVSNPAIDWGRALADVQLIHPLVLAERLIIGDFAQEQDVTLEERLGEHPNR